MLGVRTRGSNRRGIRTRGGRNSSGQKKDDRKPRKNKRHMKNYLETKWKHEDHQPDIPPFTNQPKLNVQESRYD